MKYFLLVYDRPAGELVEEQVFDSSSRDEALTARFAAEDKFLNAPNVEVVVLSCPTREDLLRTHSRYFRTAREMVEIGFAELRGNVKPFNIHVEPCAPRLDPLHP